MKKGFTLIEMLAVIAVLAIILLIAFNFSKDIIDKAKDNLYKRNNDSVLKAVTNYFSVNPELLPKTEGQTIEISINDLKSDNYLGNIKDPKDGSDCSGYISVTKSQTNYLYIPNIKCDNTINNSAEDGLVLNYTFDFNRQGTINEYTYPTFDTSTASGNWSHWAQAGGIGTYGQNTDKKYIYGNQTYSHWWKDDITATGNYLLYQSPAFVGGYRSLTAIIKMEDEKPVTNSKVYPAWNAGTAQGIPSGSWTSIEKLEDNFYLCKAEGIYQDGSNDLVGLYITPGNKAYVSMVLLEQKKKATYNYHKPNYNLLIDSSTSANNIVLQGTSSPTWINKMYEFNGTSTYITAGNPANLNLTNTGTISFFAKSNTEYPSVDATSVYKGLVSKSPGGGAGAQSYYIDWYGTNASRTLRAAIGDSTSAISLTVSNFDFNNEMNHIVYTWNGTIMKLYINGIERASAAQTKNAQVMATDLEIGRAFSGSGYTFNGLIDDVKIYNRAISINEVKEIYNGNISKY